MLLLLELLVQLIIELLNDVIELLPRIFNLRVVLCPLFLFTIAEQSNRQR